MPSNIVKIIENTAIAPSIYKMTVPFTGEEAPKAGQFFMLKDLSSATLLPRPISVCDWADGILTFLYQAVGRGTNELARMQPGAELLLTGPLGNGFPIAELQGKIALVSGGIGTAPMVLTAQKLKEAGCTVDCFCGFRSQPFLTDELAARTDSVHIATEDGSVGTRGFVTAILNPRDYAAVLCCGPEPMMKAVTNLCKTAGTPVYVSLENKMACGVGGCLVCTCTDNNGKNWRTCKEGPVFRGEEINFDA